MKGLFKRQKSYPCYYIHKTNNKKRPNGCKLYMHRGATRWQLKENKVNPRIVTVRHGKKLFYRFLKEREAYAKFMSAVRICRYDINFLMRDNFFTPFAVVINQYNKAYDWAITVEQTDRALKYKNIIKYFIDLQNEWLTWLKTLGLEYRIPKIHYKYEV